MRIADLPSTGPAENVVAVFKADAAVAAADGTVLGRGMIFVHLPRGLSRAQDAGGTASLASWQDADLQPTELRLGDGRRFAILVTKDALSECSRNRVLRFRLSWPGA